MRRVSSGIQLRMTIKVSGLFTGPEALLPLVRQTQQICRKICRAKINYKQLILNDILISKFTAASMFARKLKQFV
jgi:hypothetical protein